MNKKSTFIVDKKRIATIFTMTKLPILIYLVITILTVPSIEAIKYDYIFGAHRGDSIEHTENTFQAIQSALEKHEYNFVEFDVQYTKDKKIVVFHDKSLFRMQGNYSKICNLTYEELQNISTYEIPLYKNIMDIIGKNKKIGIEIKSCGNYENDKELVDFVIADAKQRGILDNIIIIAISRDVLMYVKENYPNIKTGQVFLVFPSTYFHFDFLTQYVYDEVEQTGADYIMLHGSNIHNIDSLTRLKPQDKTLIFWYFTNEMYIVQKDNTDVLW